MRRYVHWLRINGIVMPKDEYRQYMEIDKYLKAYPEAVATIWGYKYGCFVNRVVKLICNENYKELNLSEKCLSHSLRRLTHKPQDIENEMPFYIPDYVIQEDKAN